MGQSPCFGKIQAGSINAAGNLVRPARNTTPKISLSDLRKATNNFHKDEELGEGGSAHVYKGTLKTRKIDQTVAVKRLDPVDNRDVYYASELSILSRLNHPNIIKIVGCCSHKDEERIVVYEFMPSKTLDHWLHARETGELALDWGTRMRIGRDVAKGLSYLHNEATPEVIFRDLKPANVLLDQWNHAKISDFGLALTLPPGAPSSTEVPTEPMGTIPYAAPEATRTNSVSLKSDVFSFGVVLLEIIHGSVPIDSNNPSLVAEWVLQPENLDRVPDPEMNGRFVEADLVKAMKLVTRCMKENPDSRPDMSVVEVGMRNLCGERNVEWPVEINTEVEQAGSSSSSVRTHD